MDEIGSIKLPSSWNDVPTKDTNSRVGRPADAQRPPHRLMVQRPSGGDWLGNYVPREEVGCS